MADLVRAKVIPGRVQSGIKLLGNVRKQTLLSIYLYVGKHIL